MTEPTPLPADQDVPPPKRRAGKLRWLALVLAGLLLTLVALAALLAYAAMTDSGSRQAWRVATWAMQGKLSGQYDGGNLAQGVHMRNLRYRSDALQLEIDRIDSSWRLSPWQRKFSIAYLRIGKVNVVQQPTPATPTQLPQSLRLPLALELRELSLQQLHFQQGSTLIALGVVKLHGNSDGQHHTLVLDQLDSGFGNASALLHLDGERPFATSGGVELAGHYRQDGIDEKFQISTQLSGSLQELVIALTASGDKLNGNADIIATPFATVPLKQALINLQHINPQVFVSAAPSADLHLRADLRPVALASPDAKAMRVAGTVELVNLIPGSIDRQRLPIKALHANVDLGVERQQLSDLRIDLLDHASLIGGGQFQPDQKSGAFQFQVHDLDLHALHPQLKPTRLQGPLNISIKPEQLNLGLQWQDRNYAIALDAMLAGGKIIVKQARLSAAKARLDLSGSMATGGDMGYALQGQLRNFDPAQWLQKGAVAARINMDFNASGVLSPQPQTRLNFTINDSSYAQLPMSGSGSVQLAGTRLLPSNADLLVAGNRLQLKGAFGAAQDRLDIHLDAPQLARLGYGLSGQIKLDGQLSGSMQRPALRATYSGSQLRFGPHQLEQFSGQADLQTDLGAAMASPNNKLMLVIEGKNYRGPDALLHQLKLKLDGTYGAHALSLQADGNSHGQTLALQLAAHGKLTQAQGAYGWTGVIDKLDNQGLPRVTLGMPLSLAISADSVQAGATRLQVDRMAIDVQNFSYQHGSVHSQGSAKAVDIGRILELVQQLGGAAMPFKTDLVLDADWNFSLAETASGFIRIARKSGDLSINTTANVQSPLGLSDLQMRVDLAGQQARLDGRIVAARIGTLQAHGSVGLLQEDGILVVGPASPLALDTSLTIPTVKNVAALLGPQYSLEGKLALQLKVAGTLARPRLSGQIDGEQLAVTLFDQGIQLKDGVVNIVMDDNVIDLRQIQFHGGDGTLRATGKVQLGAENPDLKATIVADKLQLFASPDRQLMLSGQAQLANVAEQLRIDGKFVVDKALFDLPKTSAPKLGDDVVIVRKGNAAKAGAASSQEKLTAATEKPAGRFAPIINIQVNLGNNFRFNGSGADLLLRGDMSVHSEPLQPLRATGTVQVAEGTYEAFGTKLNIERGIINFQGPISNPNLNILAMRRNQDVEAGVEVTGFANQPRVRLVSEPNVSDDEKLSWMMFGHGSDSSGLAQRSASSQALAFIGNYGGKKIAKGIGLDEFSIGTSESGLTDDQVVNLGKAISERLSLGYEQSLTGAASVAKATWQLSQRWSAVARAGTINGVNFIYSLRFD